MLVRTGHMNTDTAMLHHTQERNYSAHNSFIHIALLEVELAKPGMVGEFNHALVALTLSALAVEAMANAMGDRIVPQWSDYESLSPQSKLRFLAERLGLKYASDEEPWGTIRWLCKLRNRLAHAKPEVVKKTALITQEEHDTRRFQAPASKLEEEITEPNARRAIAAVEAVKYALCDLIPPHLRFGLVSEGWSSSAMLADVAFQETPPK